MGTRNVLGSVAVAAILTGLAGNAQAQLFVEGSSFNIIGENSPGTFTSPVHIVQGVFQETGVGNQLTTIAVSETPDGFGGEWISFSYTGALEGGPFFGSDNNNWSLNEVGLQTNQPTDLVGSFELFNNGSGIAHSPTGNCQIVSPNSVIGSDPTGLFGGANNGCLTTGFSTPFAAGPLPEFGTSLSPFSIISSLGIAPLSVAGYFQALDFRPHSEESASSVPEPASMLILGTGAIGLMWSRKSGRKSCKREEPSEEIAA